MDNITYANARNIRKEKKMSLKELSERSGLSMAYLSNFENGKVNITVASLYQIAKALGVSVKALLATEEDKNILVVPSDKRFSVIEDPNQPCPPIQEFLTRGASFDMQVTVMHMAPHTDSGRAQDPRQRGVRLCAQGRRDRLHRRGSDHPQRGGFRLLQRLTPALLEK